MSKAVLDSKFKEITNQIKNAVVDFTTLEVTSLMRQNKAMKTVLNTEKEILDSKHKSS